MFVFDLTVNQQFKCKKNLKNKLNNTGYHPNNNYTLYPVLT
jgi:hypothetical protein